jgi:hypothetical protein
MSSKKSGYISTPARIKIRELDDASGRYPAIKRVDPSQADMFVDNNSMSYDEQLVTFPMMLPSGSEFTTQSISSEDIRSDINVNVVVKSKNQPNYLYIKNEKEITGFNDQTTLEASDFFMSGTNPEIVPNFTSPLRSKHKIEIDITPRVGSVFTRNVKSRNISESQPVSNNNTGFKYFNFDLKEWQQIGLDDHGTGTPIPYDYSIDPLDTYGSGKFPMQFVQSNHDSNEADGTFSYDKIGSPTTIAKAPYARIYHATSSQCLKLSNYISQPFLLEGIKVELNNVNAQRMNGHTNPPAAIPLSLKQIYKSGSSRDIDNYVFFIYRQAKMNGVDRDVKSETRTSKRFLIASGSMTFWNSASLNGSQLLHSPAFSYEFGLPYSDNYALGQYTGSIAMNLIPGANPIRFEGSSHILADPALTILKTTNLLHFWPGSTSPNSLIEPPVASIESSFYSNVISKYQNYDPRILKRYTAENQSNIKNSDDTFTSQNSAYSSPYILFPNDELIFGIEAGVGPSRYASSVSHLTSSHLTISSDNCKITLLGSLINDGAELLSMLDQNLTSNSIHEVVGSDRVIDQFQIETSGSYFSSYLDEILTGSLVTYSNGEYTTFDQDEVGSRCVVAKASTGGAGSTGSLQRFVVSSDTNERIYDSCLPDYREYLSNSATFFENPITKKLVITVDSPFINENIGSTPPGLLPDQFPFMNDPTRIKTNSSFDVSLKSNWVDPPGMPTLNGVNLENDKKIRSIVFRTGWKIHPTLTSTGYIAHRYENYASSLESQRPVSLGSAYRYGISNVEPQYSRSVWRLDHFGHFRDILEQRQFTATPGSEPPIKCRFFSGSVSVTPENTISQNLSVFATSSLPYFDDETSHNRNTDAIDMLEVV